MRRRAGGEIHAAVGERASGEVGPVGSVGAAAGDRIVHARCPAGVAAAGHGEREGRAAGVAFRLAGAGGGDGQRGGRGRHGVVDRERRPVSEVSRLARIDIYSNVLDLVALQHPAKIRGGIVQPALNVGHHLRGGTPRGARTVRTEARHAAHRGREITTGGCPLIEGGVAVV